MKIVMTENATEGNKWVEKPIHTLETLDKAVMAAFLRAIADTLDPKPKINIRGIGPNA